MNFLQLCQAVSLDSGTVAGVPNFTTVTGATGRVAQVVGWVRDAWIDIQNERNDWLWMRKTFTRALVISQISYTATDLGIADFGSMLPDIPREGWHNLSIYETGLQAQETELWQIDYPLFRSRYQRGVHDANKPSEWSVSPQKSILFGNKPDKAYIVTGEYRPTPQVLALDIDTPEMPVAYHRLIVGEAIRLMARSDEAFQVLGEKAQQYERLRHPLVNEQTPALNLGGGAFA